MDIPKTKGIQNDMNKTGKFCFNDATELEQVSGERMYVCGHCGAQFMLFFDEKERVKDVRVQFAGF